KDIYTIKVGNYFLKFSHKITQYYEFKNSAIVYVGKLDILYGIGFTENSDRKRDLSILWQFNQRPILSFSKDKYESKEVVRIRTNASFHEILYLIDPETGDIIVETPIR